MRERNNNKIYVYEENNEKITGTSHKALNNNRNVSATKYKERKEELEYEKRRE